MDIHHKKTDHFYKICDSMKEYMSYLSNDQKVFFYALFKQGTVGNAPEEPIFSDPVTVAKWEAWNKRRYMDCMEAKQIYVNTAVVFLKQVENKERMKFP